MYKVIAAAITLLATLLEPNIADALTVSGTVRYWDTRTFRSDSTGSLLGFASYQTNQTVKQPLLHLLDLDGACIDFKPPCSETDDDVLAITHASTGGVYSFSNIGTGHDLYLVHYFYHGLPGVVVKTEDDGSHIVVSEPVLTNTSANVVRDFNVTCPDDAANAAQGRCDSQADVNSFFAENEAFANMAASMLHVDGRIGGIFGTDLFLGYWPDGPNSECDGLAGAAWINNKMCAIDATDNHVIAHEMGHLVHKKMLGIGQSSLGGTCTSGTYWSGIEASEKCATKEGFASFVAAAAWWNANSVSPRYRGYFLEGDTNAGNNQLVKKCVSNDSSPHKTEGNVARFFWDVHDSTTVGTDDPTNDDSIHNWGTIQAIWQSFQPGTANRQASESGENGRNVEDYLVNAFEQNFAGERAQNCLNAQAD